MIGRKVPLSRVFLFAEWTKYIKNQFVYQNNSFDSKINIKAHNYLLQFVIKVQHFIDTNTIKYFYLNLKFIFECFLEDAFSEPARMFINSDKKSWNEPENLFSDTNDCTVEVSFHFEPQTTGLLSNSQFKDFE